MNDRSHPVITDWNEFIIDYWGRRPAVLRLPQASAFAQPDDYFDVLLAAANAYRQGSLADPGDIRLLLDHGTVMPGYAGDFYPRPTDRGLEGYAERISGISKLGFNIVVNSAQQFSAELWRTARDFLTEVYASAGKQPAGLTDCHVIAGRYEEAPTRLHKDTADVFTLVLKGRKSMWVWPYEAFQDLAPPNGYFAQVNLDISPPWERGQCLEGGAGDLLYWPAPYWHCAASDGGLHATLHLASYRDGNLLHAARQLLDKMIGERLNNHWEQDRLYDPKHPETLLDDTAPDGILTELRELLVQDQFAKRWHVKWLRRASSGNFEVVPPLTDVDPVDPDTVLQANPRFPVLLSVFGDQPFCAANGHVFAVPTFDTLQALIEQINTGKPTTPKELLLALDGTPPSLKSLCSLLSLLCRARALERVG